MRYPFWIVLVGLWSLACGGGREQAEALDVRIEEPGADEPTPLLHVLDTNGVEVALRRADSELLVPGDREAWSKIGRLFAADCAERALLRERELGREPDDRSWAAVLTARRYANGEVDGRARLSAESAAEATTILGATPDGPPMAAAFAAWFAVADDDTARVWNSIRGGKQTGAASTAALACREHAASVGEGVGELQWQAERLRHYLSDPVNGDED